MNAKERLITLEKRKAERMAKAEQIGAFMFELAECGELLDCSLVNDMRLKKERKRMRGGGPI